METLHPTASLAATRAQVKDLKRELKDTRWALEVLRAHVDDGTEECSVCRDVIKEYDRKWGARDE